MASIIPKAYYCPTCKKEIGKKVCECGTKTKPVPPYYVRFRWIGENGIEVNKKLSDKSWNTRAAAQHGYDLWISKHPQNKKIEKDDLKITTLYEEYKSNLKLTVKESSYVLFTYSFETHMLPYFKDKVVTDIKPTDIIKWQALLSSKGYTYKYKCTLRSILSHFFSYLKIYGISNPVSIVPGFKRLNEHKKEMAYWVEDEFQQFIRAVTEPMYKCLFSYLYLTGNRIGEALALQWSDIDLDTGEVNICKTLTPKAVDCQYKITPPKTLNSYRKILLPKSLISLLSNYKASINAKEIEYVFGGEKFLIFTTVRYKFDLYIKASGVKRIRVHDLRHSHASLLINTGENQLATIYIIAQRLGDTVEMIFRTYGHMFPNTQKDMINRLNINLE